MTTKVLNGMTLSLSQAMYAAVRDSLGLAPTVVSDEQVASTVRKGLADLAAAGLVIESDDSYVTAEVARDALKATLDPDVIVRSVYGLEEAPVVTSVFLRRGLAPVEFPGVDAMGVRSYAIADWSVFLDHLVEPFEGVVLRKPETSRVATSEIVAWIDGLADADPDDTGPTPPVASLPRADLINAAGNIAVVASSNRSVVDARNVALVRAGSEAWIIEQHFDDAEQSTVRGLTIESLRAWIDAAVSGFVASGT